MSGIAVYHLLKKHVEEKNGSGFWMTVIKVELADIAFAVDVNLAAGFAKGAPWKIDGMDHRDMVSPSNPLIASSTSN